MTFAELAAFREHVADQKARGETPKAADLVASGPGTLAVALAAEARAAGHVEFKGGVPRWVPGPARFVAGEQP